MEESYIYDKEQVFAFFEKFRPKADDEIIRIEKTLRRKYNERMSVPNVKVAKLLVGKETTDEDIEYFFEDEETEQGFYTVFFCSIRPKSTFRALKKIYEDSVTLLMNGKPPGNVLKLLESEILKKEHSVGEKMYQIDLDTKDKALIEELKPLVKESVNVVMTVETKNGYHIIYDKVLKGTKELNQWGKTHGEVKTAVNGKGYIDPLLSISSDPDIVVPGSLQAGFGARIVDIF